MASPPRFCPHCGAPVNENGVYRHRHVPLAGGGMSGGSDTADLFAPPSIGDTLRLSWRMVASRWSVLWLPVIAFVTGLLWDLLFILLFGAGLGGHLGNGLSFSLPWHLKVWRLVPWHLYTWHIMPFELPPAETWALAAALVRLITAWMLLPYLQAGLIGGIIRAVAEEAAPLEFWADGFRYLGRSYLAVIGTIVAGLAAAVVGSLWSLIFFGIVGHGVGAVIGAIGDAVLIAYAIPALSLVSIAIYQSGWVGFGLALHVVRRHWGAIGVLVLCFAALFAAATGLGYGIVLGLERLFPALMAPFFAGPVLGLGIPWLFSWVASVFAIGGLLIFYRRATGMALGLWAPVALQI